MAGVVIVGRPVARHMADGWTAEVTRLCTDGTPNACSLLYGAAWRAARAMGYRRLVTYTLAVEPGTSLRAAGWRVVAKVPRRSWDRPERPRVDLHPLQERLRWEVSEGGFDRRRYDVGPLPEAEARPFVEANHYSAVSVRAVQGAGRVSQRFICSMQRGREGGR